MKFTVSTVKLRRKSKKQSDLCVGCIVSHCVDNILCVRVCIPFLTNILSSRLRRAHEHSLAFTFNSTNKIFFKYMII